MDFERVIAGTQPRQRLVRICLADPSFAFVAGIVERLPIRKLALLQQPLTSEMMSVSSRNQIVARDAAPTFSMKVQSTSNRLDIEFCYSRVPLRFESETRKLVESGPNTPQIGRSSRFDTGAFRTSLKEHASLAAAFPKEQPPLSFVVRGSDLKFLKTFTSDPRKRAAFARHLSNASSQTWMRAAAHRAPE
jgi:hypothetical protein